jgi:hypothetical protein
MAWLADALTAKLIYTGTMIDEKPPLLEFHRRSLRLFSADSAVKVLNRRER